MRPNAYPHGIYSTPSIVGACEIGRLRCFLTGWHALRRFVFKNLVAPSWTLGRPKDMLYKASLSVDARPVLRWSLARMVNSFFLFIERLQCCYALHGLYDYMNIIHHLPHDRCGLQGSTVSRPSLRSVATIHFAVERYDRMANSI